MIRIKKNINLFLLAVLIAAVFPLTPARGTIASVVLTPANPTNLSNGLQYYLAGIEYSFTVQVIDPDLTNWAQWTSVTLTIPNSTAITLSMVPSGTGTGLPVTVSTGLVNAVADVTGTYNNCTIVFRVTIRWDTSESAYTANRNVQVTCQSSYPAANSVTENSYISYGVCSTMKIYDFAMDGVAADGMINKYHDTFNVTGVPVYNVTGATGADAIESVDPGEITGTTLYLNGVTTLKTCPVNTVSPYDVTYAVTVSVLPAALVAGTNTFAVLATMSTAGGPESSSNTAAVDCDEVEVTGISFVNGGGINLPAYYRSINIPGTQIVVNARMKNSLSGMVGNTTVRIFNITDAAQYIDVPIANGATSGTVLLPNPSSVTGLPVNPGSIQNSYRAEVIVGGSYGGDAAGQNTFTNITQPLPIGTVSIYWDNGYYPWAGSNPYFTTWNSVSTTAYSATFSWGALAYSAPNQDFLSYRIYYKNIADTLWQLIDKDTSGYSSLGSCTTSTATIAGLKPLTQYDYYITAVDVFGQEVPSGTPTGSPPSFRLPNGTTDTFGTLASTVRVEITDGITTYTDSSFTTASTAPDVPANRGLRKTAINVKIFIVAAGDLPDIVNLIVANNSLGASLTASSSAINPALTLNTDYYRISTLKTGTNTWSGYIPDTLPFMTVGNSVRFIVETVKNSVYSYADNDSETESAPGNANDYPYTFSISSAANFTPWPTRILNNVITAENPRAYPAYYLTDDAYVSIVIYDIKGRTVKTLLDDAFRKGGQNIKEGGWIGDNKSRRKVGVGLYYMHFRAKRASDGKIILDSFQKVVMAY